jgi:prevent-host-death family protein
MVYAIDLANDICPVSEFRADINTMIQKTKSTHRPIVLTQHGKTSAVVMDISDYQRLVYERQLFEDIRISQEQAANGQVLTTNELKSRLKKRFGDVQI